MVSRRIGKNNFGTWKERGQRVDRLRGRCMSRGISQFCVANGQVEHFMM